jgi:Family of unknown function (DUF5947)
VSSNGGGEGRAAAIAGLRRMARGQSAAPPGSGASAADEQCEVCGSGLSADHRHMLDVSERRILCACEPCIAMKAGIGSYRRVGTRVLWLGEFDLQDDLWARMQIPIGLAFFMHSSTVGGIVSLYPSPAGATESELDLAAWDELSEANPILAGLEPDVEALIVDRTSEPSRYAIAPIDECYRLVGMVKANWEGISGGDAIERTVPGFFDELRERAA